MPRCLHRFRFVWSAALRPQTLRYSGACPGAVHSWSDLIQLKYLAESTGLMVGLSLTDRNMRRLLNALRRARIRSENYVLLQRPQWLQPNHEDLRQIHIEAEQFMVKFAGSGVPPRAERFPIMEEVIRRVERFDQKQQTKMLRELNVEPIWYENHDEVPGLLAQVMA